MNTAHNNNAIAMRMIETSTVRPLMFGLMIAFGVAFIALSAKIQVPFWPVPMTLQTFAILALSAAYGMRLGVATILAYLGAGAAGLPVFAGPIAGLGYFVGPTAGFLAGFIVLAVIVGWAADQGWGKNPVKMFIAMLTAEILLFALGFLWLAFIFVSAKTGNTLGAETAFAAAVKPYILGDLVKIALAAIGIYAIDRNL